jgi:Restriction endonuclease fold toxin 7
MARDHARPTPKERNDVLVPQSLAPQVMVAEPPQLPPEIYAPQELPPIYAPQELPLPQEPAIYGAVSKAVEIPPAATSNFWNDVSAALGNAWSNIQTSWNNLTPAQKTAAVAFGIGVIAAGVVLAVPSLAVGISAAITVAMPTWFWPVALGTGAAAVAMFSGTMPSPAQGTSAAAAAVAETEELSGTALARQLGTSGENLAGINQAAKVRIPSLTNTAPYRIPDALTKTTLTEVKNVSYLPYTSQLQDFSYYATQTGRQFNLVVRANTVLSGPLEDIVNMVGSRSTSYGGSRHCECSGWVHQ